MFRVSGDFNSGYNGGGVMNIMTLIGRVIKAIVRSMFTRKKNEERKEN